MQTQNYGSESDAGFSDTAAAGLAESRLKLDQAASKAHETVDRVHRKATEVSDRVTTEGERMYDQARGWVSGHPLQAVAGALFVGYLFGRLRS